MIQSSVRLTVGILFSFALFTFGCGRAEQLETSDLNGTRLAAGISTEHNIDGVDKTACSFTRDQIKEMSNRGYYYAAVPESIFRGGKNCGRILTVTVGGTCFENHTAACKEPNGNASVAEYQKASGQKPPRRTVHLFIADSCGSCLNDRRTPHVDIDSRAISGNGPLGPLRNFFERNLQRIKQNGTNKTGQPNNYFLNALSLRSCAPGLRFEPWVTKGFCNR